MCGCRDAAALALALPPICKSTMFQLCSHCGQLIHIRFNGCCPRCRPHFRTIGSGGTPRSVDSDGLPSIVEISRRSVRTVKYVPRGARELWGQCLTRSLADAFSKNDVRHWKELHMIAKCILAAPPRQGKKMKDQSMLIIKNRAQCWLNGER